MAKETLNIPEEHLQDVIDVIRGGLGLAPRQIPHPDVREALSKWCDDIEAHHFGVPDQEEED